MTKEQIRVLSNKEQARERINVFHGSSNNWINLVKELVGNSLDIFKKNNSTDNEIQIIIHNKNKVEFIDNATGIPVNGTASNGDPNYVAIFETPFAGSNYDNINDTVGQNGLFLWTLSMTCENIEYFISRNDKKIYNIAYHKGNRIKELSVVGSSDKTYSRLIFELDEDVWENPNFTFEIISEIAKAQSSRGNVKIVVKDVKTNKENMYYYEGGLEQYFNELTDSKSKVIENISIKSSKEMNINIKGKDVIERFSTNLIFSYSNDNEDDIKKEFLNTADLIQYGTIQEGMILGLKNSIHKWLKDNGKYQKNEKNIASEDVFIGLNYVSDNTSLYVEYENQIKVKSSTKRYINLMKSIIEDFMEVFFIENKQQTELLCNQILINKRAREKSDSIRNDIKSKLTNSNKKGLSQQIEGLNHCNMRRSTLEERIFLVTEGKSPNSTVVSCFDNRYMGSMGLRGRFISCLKCSVEDVLKNEPALGLIQALGCGIEIPKEERKKFKDIKTFNIDDLKYGAVGILCDADCYGRAINLALITFFYKFMPTLLKQGRIYLVISPRYEILTKKDEVFYVYNEQEKLDKINEIGENNIKSIGIKKGLGEFDKNEFWDYVLSPDARKKTFIRVEYSEDNFNEIEQYFNMFMGEDTADRKQFIRDNITNVNLDEIE